MSVRVGPYSITLGDLQMSYKDTITGNPTAIVDTLEGWLDSVPFRTAVEDKAAADGGWDAVPLLSSRTVALGGVLIGTSQANVLATADTLNEVLTTGQQLRLSVHHEDVGERWSMVRPIGQTKLMFLGDTAMRFEVIVVAPDPRKYGPAVFASTDLSGQAGTGLVYPLAYPLDYGVPAGQTPGSIPVGNSGTAPYWPRLRIDGPVPNPVVTLNETGDWVRFNGTVKAGQWLDVDLASRRVLLNGQVSVRQFITSHGAWLQVPKGGGSISWEADAADPAARLSVWSYEGAWL